MGRGWLHARFALSTDPGGVVTCAANGGSAIERRLGPGLSVDRLAEEVCVAVVPGVLLDHVQQDPAQRDWLAVGGGAGGEGVQAVDGEGPHDMVTGPVHCVAPAGAQVVGFLVGSGAPLPVRVDAAVVAAN